MADKALILVVDDEKGIREGCRRILASEGYDVEVASSGTEGLEMVKAKPYDLLLVDLMMPGMGGLEMMEQVSRIDPDIIMIVITGFATIETAVDAMRCGASDYISKPFTPDQLIAFVQKGLEKRSLRLQTRRAAKHFVTRMTHELRAPLSAIQGYLSAYLTQSAGSDPQVYRQMMERANQRAAAMLELINDLLQYSRLEAMPERKKAPLRVSDVIMNAVELFRIQGEQKKITFDVNIPESLPLINADRTEMDQLFTNLISNAVKYNVQGGKVSVKAEQGGSFLRIIVSDSGIGIDEESVPCIFEEFYRACGSETRYVTGTGLGLSIAKKIVDAHLGSIKADSRPGEGTTFTVTLPIGQEKANPQV